VEWEYCEVAEWVGGRDGCSACGLGTVRLVEAVFPGGNNLVLLLIFNGTSISNRSFT
jgi:hypothetical protein